MPNRIVVIHDNRPEGVVRRNLWVSWAVGLVFIAWFLSWPMPLLSAWFAFGPILVGVLAGWLFGYRLGFGPLFTGVHIFKSD